jgi:hypothetical protein
VVSDLWGEIVTANKQSTKILDMMIDGMQQKNLPMAVAPLNSQRYEMILDVNGSKNLMQGWKMGMSFG